MIQGKNINFDIDSSIVEKKSLVSPSIVSTKFFCKGERSKNIRVVFDEDLGSLCSTIPDQKYGPKVLKKMYNFIAAAPH
jgi:hypothetical protein